MSGSGRKILAAGAAVFDSSGRVLVIHRPGHADITLPKGKLERGEHPAVAAVREVAEETGAIVALEAQLPTVHYPTPAGPKSVDWWRARLLEQRPRTPDDEVDRAWWLSPAEAARELTHDSDRQTLAAALAAGPGPALIVLRHGKALARKAWDGTDLARPLAPAGQRQADTLADVLAAYGVRTVISSPAERCVATVRPYASRHGLRIALPAGLTEPCGERDPAQVRRIVADAAREAARTGRAVVLCGHRPVLPDMLRAAGLPEAALVPGELRTRNLSADPASSGPAERDPSGIGR
ncbi:8-oxo-dGTP diphosphatase [Naumannella cuiyingiana]|uniref:8-oxo-dGTP diphosphatase n=1 Tax=Naumannella cuiyingiana TaxID=1347891 RepID=A0A7Z0ILH2_9ACTN|nr:NUDIX hydrolase [Naumannella cuiyingiana]NYI71527.1 8-oxo-dGTP diphosphatase [Naumannella cuiyingiana]